MCSPAIRATAPPRFCSAKTEHLIASTSTRALPSARGQKGSRIAAKSHSAPAMSLKLRSRVSASAGTSYPTSTSSEFYTWHCEYRDDTNSCTSYKCTPDEARECGIINGKCVSKALCMGGCTEDGQGGAKCCDKSAPSTRQVADRDPAWRNDRNYV